MFDNISEAHGMCQGLDNKKMRKKSENGANFTPFLNPTSARPG